jgi:ABC-2 type transport system permease protein
MWPFIKKEFYHIFRDPRTLIILFGIPLAQVLLFGFAITNDITNAHIAVLDHSHDVATRQITRKLLSSNYFLLDSYLQSEKDIHKAFQKGAVKEVIVFEKDFAQKLEKQGKAHVQIILDATEPNTANILNAYTSGIINAYALQWMKRNTSIPVAINVQTKMLYNEQLRSVFMFVPGVITILLLLISTMLTSISITREKELGTMEALLASPVKPLSLIAGKVIPFVILSFFNLITILLLSVFVFGMPIRGSISLLLLESLLFIIMSLALGILISTVSKTQQQAMMLSMFALLLPAILLSGFIFPVENMPDILRYLSTIMPSRWFIIIIKSIMIKGVGIAYFWKETLIILFSALFFIGLSVKKFNIRLEDK